MGEPISCLEAHPNSRSIQLGGKYINLLAIARSQGMDNSYMSRILSGRRDPGQMSVKQAMKIAAALGMGLEELIDAIYARMEQLAGERARVQIIHTQRMQRERAADTRAVNRGLPPEPHIFDAP